MGSYCGPINDWKKENLLLWACAGFLNHQNHLWNSVNIFVFIPLAISTVYWQPRQEEERKGKKIGREGGRNLYLRKYPFSNLWL